MPDAFVFISTGSTSVKLASYTRDNLDSLSGVPIPKFARVCRTFSRQLRNQRGTSNL